MDYKFLADRLEDAFWVLRSVPANLGSDALTSAGVEYDRERGTGTRDGLADDVLEAAHALRKLA